ncbi:hypothetical protein M407DRAFT_20023 [Tulasnella calospora MUT 4182]|uniref:RRM domain-containing protein n=1 Tax=Tulasnella calospora MUT 4182 TaxID=1051891 RepID=A0A0C3QQS1_9AGAM|nr:hypothetical protein M407DRAFT_20023 [Tulasnella calospora MUT 4182]
MGKKSIVGTKPSKAAAPAVNGKAKVQPKKPTKKAPALPPPAKDNDSSDSESSSEEEEEEKPKPQAKAANGKAAPKKAGKAKQSESESGSGSDSDSSESEDDKAVAPAAKKAVQATKDAAKAIGKVGANAAKAAVPAAKAVVSTVTKGVTSKEGNKESSSSSESGSDSDDDSDASSVAGKAKATAKAAGAKANGAVAKAKIAVAAPAKKAEAKAKSDSESSSGSDDSSSGEDSDGSSESDEDGDAKMKDPSKAAEDTKAESKPTGLKRKAEDDQEAANKKSRPDAEGSTTIFVGRLSFNVDDDWLKTEFDQYGTVTSSRVIIQKDTGRSKGFGYVTFETAEAAKAALERNGQEIDGRPINVDLASPQSAPGERSDRPPRRNSSDFGRGNGSPQKPTGPATSTLFVGNLPFSASEDQIWEKFADFGSVSSVRLPTDRETGQPKGFGYVEFLTVESAQKAVDGAASLEIDGRVPRLDFSQPRDSNGGGRGGFGAPRGRGGPRGGGRGFGGGGRGGGFGGGGRGFGGGGRGRGGGGSRYFAPPAGKKTTFD